MHPSGGLIYSTFKQENDSFAPPSAVLVHNANNSFPLSASSPSTTNTNINPNNTNINTLSSSMIPPPPQSQSQPQQTTHLYPPYLYPHDENMSHTVIGSAGGGGGGIIPHPHMYHPHHNNHNNNNNNHHILNPNHNLNHNHNSHLHHNNNIIMNNPNTTSLTNNNNNINNSINNNTSDIIPSSQQQPTSPHGFRVYTEVYTGAQEIMANKHRFQLWNVNFSKPIRHPYLCHDRYLYKHMGKKTNKAGNHVVYYYCITGKGFDEKYWGDRPKPMCKASVGIERDAHDGIVSIMVKHCHKHISSCELFPKEAINWVKPWNLYVVPLTNQVKGFEELWNPEHKRPKLSDANLRLKRKGSTLDSDYESYEEMEEEENEENPMPGVIETGGPSSGVSGNFNPMIGLAPPPPPPPPVSGGFPPVQYLGSSSSNGLGMSSNWLNYGPLPPHHPHALLATTSDGDRDIGMNPPPRKKRRLENGIAVEGIEEEKTNKYYGDDNDDTNNTNSNLMVREFSAPPLLNIISDDSNQECSVSQSPFGPAPVVAPPLYFGPPPPMLMNGMSGGSLPIPFSPGHNHSSNTGNPSYGLSQANIIQMGTRIKDDEMLDDDDMTDDEEAEEEVTDEEGGLDNGTNPTTEMEEGTSLKKRKRKPRNHNTLNRPKKYGANGPKIVYETPEQVSAILTMIDFRSTNRKDGHHIMIFDRNEYYMNNKRSLTKNKSNNNNNMLETNNNNGITSMMPLVGGEHENNDNRNGTGNEHTETEQMYSHYYACKKMNDCAIKCKAKIIVRAGENYETSVLSSNPPFNKGISRVMLKGTHNHNPIF